MAAANSVCSFRLFPSLSLTILRQRIAGSGCETETLASVEVSVPENFSRVPKGLQIKKALNKLRKCAVKHFVLTKPPPALPCNRTKLLVV